MAVLGAYSKDEKIESGVKTTLERVKKDLEGLRKYFFSRKDESLNKKMAMGGSLQGHGLEVGDLIVEDLGGYIKVMSEDGKEYFHKNPKFQIPFNKSHFVNQSIEHGKKGVLGIYDPFNNYYDKISKAAIKDSQTLKDGHVTIFLTSPVTESDLKECWKRFTQTIVGG